MAGALDYCAGNAVGLCVEGGYGGMRATYHVQETIRFPPARDFRVDGGVYAVNWTGPRDRDLMVIDSWITCELHLGILVHRGHGGSTRIRPVDPVPIGGFPVVIETEIHSQGIAAPLPSRRVDYSNSGEAGILMSVGDALETESQVAPVLQVIPVKVR